MASGKYRWFKLLLWADNEVHMKILDYLKSEDNPYQGCYIYHEPEVDEKKPHYHCVLYYPNPRTGEGVSKSFGSCYLITASDGKKYMSYDKSGHDDDEIEIIRALSYTKINGIIADNSDISEIKDISSWAMYMIHKNYECMIKGKKEYDISDIKSFDSSNDVIEKMFEFDKIQATNGPLQEIIDIIDDNDISSMKALVRFLAREKLFHLIRYVQSNTYLIKTMIYD